MSAFSHVLNSCAEYVKVMDSTKAKKNGKYKEKKLKFTKALRKYLDEHKKRIEEAYEEGSK